MTKGYVMPAPDFDAFFTGAPKNFLLAAIIAALQEDGPDLTSLAVFAVEKNSSANLLCKQSATLAGLPLVPLIMNATVEIMNEEASANSSWPGLNSSAWSWQTFKQDGDAITKGEIIASINAPACLLLRAERVILNFLSHLSGVATLTQRYVKELEGTGVVLLDTRKTLPGLRYPEKYAVRSGGGQNHRCNLSEMLMLKNNHIDAAGGIARAVERLRSAYAPCPPIEIECRTLAEVEEALTCTPERIMLDNMNKETLQQVLPRIPAEVKVEISGGVGLEELRELALVSSRRPDYISVGKLTHSAMPVDLSLTFANDPLLNTNKQHNG